MQVSTNQLLCSHDRASSFLLSFTFQGQAGTFRIPSKNLEVSPELRQCVIYSLLHRPGVGFKVLCPAPLFSSSTPHHIPPPSLSGIPIPSFICPAAWRFSAPLCPCTMTSGRHQQRSLLCFPPSVYRRPCDLHLPLLCQTMSHSHEQLIGNRCYYCPS